LKILALASLSVSSLDVERFDVKAAERRGGLLIDDLFDEAEDDEDVALVADLELDECGPDARD
jgi:hypothetical protein